MLHFVALAGSIAFLVSFVINFLHCLASGKPHVLGLPTSKLGKAIYNTWLAANLVAAFGLLFGILEAWIFLLVLFTFATMTQVYSLAARHHLIESESPSPR
jgi:phosphatidylglycerophosphate synthase